MTGWALTLILAASVIHATWNFLNKRASGHATFTWLVAVLSALLYAPVTITVIEVWEIEINFVAIGLMAGSAALHTAYFVLLNQGYRAGDLSDRPGFWRDCNFANSRGRRVVVAGPER